MIQNFNKHKNKFYNKKLMWGNQLGNFVKSIIGLAKIFERAESHFCRLIIKITTRKKDIIQQVLLQKKNNNNRGNIYTIASLGCFFSCNSNLNLLHQYEIIAIIIMLH